MQLSRKRRLRTLQMLHQTAQENVRLKDQIEQLSAAGINQTPETAAAAAATVDLEGAPPCWPFHQEEVSLPRLLQHPPPTLPAAQRDRQAEAGA